MIFVGASAICSSDPFGCFFTLNHPCLKYFTEKVTWKQVEETRVVINETTHSLNGQQFFTQIFNICRKPPHRGLVGQKVGKEVSPCTVMDLSL